MTYRWSVTPTSVRDRYRFTLKTTFETNVPAPVLHIEPQTLDVLELCLRALANNGTTLLTFNITNDGFIRADNVELRLPQSNSLVIFDVLLQVMCPSLLPLLIPLLFSPLL